MRPVRRGDPPREFKNYADAAPDLRNRLGGYCSYCERQIETHLAVEHVKPKKPGGVEHPERYTDWNNFLLACVHCNSHKGDTDVNLPEYVWPDSDNTFVAFEYNEGGLVRAAPLIEIRAQNMVQLVGLDVYHGNPIPERNPSSSDFRWNARREAWKMAEGARLRIARNDSPDLRDQVVETAVCRGMFSIWMTVFKDDEDMRIRLIEAFTGTAADCFDRHGQPKHRPGGQC